MTGTEDHCARAGDASQYVLGELQGRRRESFERHMHSCALCAEEVELLQSAADAVPFLAARQLVQPEEERLEARVPTLAAVAGARRPEPQASQLDQAGNNRPALRPISGAESGAARPTPTRTTPTRPTSARPTPAFPASARLRASWLGGGRRLLRNPVPKPALVGLLLLAILAIVTVALSSRASSARYVRIQAGWSKGGAALKLQGNQLEVLVKGMPRAPSGKGYQIWVVEQSSKRLTATSAWLRLNAKGEAGSTVRGDYHDWAAVAVYVEPLHGHHTTAGGAVVVGDLRHLR